MNCGNTFRGLGFLSIVAWSMCGFCAEHHPASGIVLGVDMAKKVAIISCKEIPGYMAAMTMSLQVPGSEDLANSKPGTMIDFVLVADKDDAHVESVRPHIYQGLEPDPAAARRLKLLAKAAAAPAFTWPPKDVLIFPGLPSAPLEV